MSLVVIINDIDNVYQKSLYAESESFFEEKEDPTCKSWNVVLFYEECILYFMQRRHLHLYKICFDTVFVFLIFIHLEYLLFL